MVLVAGTHANVCTKHHQLNLSNACHTSIVYFTLSSKWKERDTQDALFCKVHFCKSSARGSQILEMSVHVLNYLYSVVLCNVDSAVHCIL